MLDTRSEYTRSGVGVSSLLTVPCPSLNAAQSQCGCGLRRCAHRLRDAMIGSWTAHTAQCSPPLHRPTSLPPLPIPARDAAVNEDVGLARGPGHRRLPPQPLHRHPFHPQLPPRHRLPVPHLRPFSHLLRPTRPRVHPPPLPLSPITSTLTFSTVSMPATPSASPSSAARSAPATTGTPAILLSSATPSPSCNG